MFVCDVLSTIVCGVSGTTSKTTKIEYESLQVWLGFPHRAAFNWILNRFFPGMRKCTMAFIFLRLFFLRECLDLVDRKNSYTHNYQQESSRHIHNDIKTRYDLLLTGEEKPSENMMKNRFKEEEKKSPGL